MMQYASSSLPVNQDNGQSYMKWFKHDVDAQIDGKLRRVQIKYGLEGYGLYWYCIELIAGKVDKDNITFELDHDAEVIAHDTGIHYERIEEMMSYMVNLGLFENSNGIITCIKLAKRLDQSMTSNPEMREIISRMRGDNHDPIMTESCKIRLDQNRVEKKHNKKSSRFTPPSLDQIIIYCQERNNKINPDQFVNFYQSKNWMIGKNKMKDWKACIRTWEAKDKNTNETTVDAI